PIVYRDENIRRIGRYAVVTVDKISVTITREAVQQRRGSALLKLIPAHVRHFKVLGTGSLVGKPSHVARQQSQSFKIAHLVAALEQELHPQANAQVGDSGVDSITNRLRQALLVELLHPRAKCADSGQDDLICP